MLKHLRSEYYKKEKKLHFFIILILIIFCSFLFGIIGGFFASNFDQDFFIWVKKSFNQEVDGSLKEQGITERTIKSLIEEEGATVKAVNRVLNSTVNIVITKDIDQYYSQTGPFIIPFDFFETEPYQYSEPKGSQKTEVGGGSGFIISSNGLILTNKHVVYDTDAEYSVILSNGKRYDATVVARDPFVDLAVIKIEATDLPVITLGNSEDIALGQTVIAIGYSLSEYQNTVTKGIISGIQRRVTAQGETIDEAIQTDAAINPGNSGGPLINLKGEVIGINTAINQQGQLIGFAIPINSAKLVIESVKKYGKIVRPWLGVRYVLLNEKISKDNSLPVTYGAILVQGDLATEFAVIPGSPADKAGLEERDIILEINGKRVDENSSLAKLIGEYDVGTTINLKVLRKGKEVNIPVNLEEYKNE